MKEALEEVQKAIDIVRRSDDIDIVTAMECLRIIATNLFTLETYRSEFKKQFETKVFQLVKNGSNVNRAVNQAEVEHPQLYMLRRIMEAAYSNVDTLRTIISFKKQELNVQSTT